MHKPAFYFSLLFAVTTAALAASTLDNEILANAHRVQLQYREGHAEVAKPLVNTLEAAVARSADNPRLWEALGHAYMSLQGSMYAGPPDMSAMISAGEHARDAYARSLALDGNSALVRASHGMSQMVVSQLKGDGPGVMAGVDEMNAAVRQAPKSTAVRLTRGFTIIHLPPAMRDTPAVIEDLRHVLDTAPGGRPEDVLHVLLGDVYAEAGNFDAARAEYRQVTGASAFAAEEAQSRLEDGAVTPAAIAQVRMGTGTRCAMCHAPGTDK
jgi:cytochrome c-type biogenesis protein CcmH/NrfG